MNENDEKYVEVFLKPLRECAYYRPKLGGNDAEGVTASDFERIYGADPLYNWIGLNSRLMFAAHKAAGGITSIYRQLGIGCERLAREVFKDSLSLSSSQLEWGYEVVKDDGTKGQITLDARIDLSHIKNASRQKAFRKWLNQSGQSLQLPQAKYSALKGVVFEIRQGYKSADSKRQNADLRSALRSYSEDYLPVIMVISNQINRTVRARYLSSQMLILVGTVDGISTESTFRFFDKVAGYDLAGFFNRNQNRLKTDFEKVIKALLGA